MAELKCTIVTPETTVLDEEADFVAVTLDDGELGVAAGHAPLIGRLGDGELRISRQGQVTHFYIEGGFVEVLDDAVTVLTRKALPAQQIDPGRAREQLATALTARVATPEQVAARNRAVAQARAQLRVVRRANA